MAAAQSELINSNDAVMMMFPSIVSHICSGAVTFHLELLGSVKIEANNERALNNLIKSNWHLISWMLAWFLLRVFSFFFSVLLLSFTSIVPLTLQLEFPVDCYADFIRQCILFGWRWMSFNNKMQMNLFSMSQRSGMC